MPIPKVLASYFLFASNFRFATFTFMKHESRELNDFWNINVQKLNE